MKIVEPEVQYWKESTQYANEHIARCARICYRSEKNNDEKLALALWNNGHRSMYRHSTKYFCLPKHYLKDYALAYYFDNNPFIATLVTDKDIFVSTNLQWIKEHDNFYNIVAKWEISDMDIFNLAKENNDIYNIIRYTFRVVTQISTSRELNRVSPNNIAEQSTRYVGLTSKLNIEDYDLHTIQGIIDAYKAGYSIRTIDKYSYLNHVAIRKLLKSFSIPIRKTASLANHDAFKNIDSPEKAYLLGLIETDGSVRKSHNEVNITQHKDYYLYVESIMSYVIGDVHCIDDRDCKRLYCFSKEIVNDLIDIGIVENKTYNQTDDDIEKLINAIPKEYINSFIRGIFDGDGSIGFYKYNKGYDNNHLTICVHTKKLTDFIVNIMKEVCKKDNISVKYENNINRIILSSKNDIISFGKYLYKDFVYPFGHPNKTTKYLNYLHEVDSSFNIKFPIADFGDSKFIICKPYWLYDTKPNNIYNYIFSIYNSEKSYSNLIESGLSRQDARGVLPLDTATVCAYTYSGYEWKHILNLRYRGTTGAPHPNAKIIAGMISDKLNELTNNTIF